MFGLVPPTIPRPTVSLRKGKKAKDCLEKTIFLLNFVMLAFFLNPKVFFAQLFVIGLIKNTAL